MEAFFFAGEATRFRFFDPADFGTSLLGLNLGFSGMAAG